MPLPNLPGATGHWATAISADGSRIVGGAGSTGLEGFLYDFATGQTTGLGHAPGTTYSHALGIAADGEVFVGGGFYIGLEDVPFRATTALIRSRMKTPALGRAGFVTRYQS